MKISFCNLRRKDVINICDGKNLGNIYDIIIDTCTGKILGIVLPLGKGLINIFKSSNDLFIPYNRICKIGKDIILVDIIMQEKYVCDTDICCTQENKNTNNNPNNANINKVVENNNIND